VTGRHQTTLWARNPATVAEIEAEHTNSGYLPGVALPTGLMATTDLEKAVAQAELLIVGVPSHGFRETLEAVKAHIHPWIPVVSLSKGLEQTTLLQRPKARFWRTVRCGKSRPSWKT
jgi:glycerol-3-phosphate dehydrogenase (NAD(P)+)